MCAHGSSVVKSSYTELLSPLGVGDDLITLHTAALVTPCFVFAHLGWFAPQKRKLHPTHVPYGLFGPVIILHLIKPNGL